MTIEIANRLIELRKNRGLSQEELAERLGISRQAVSKWERAESSPDIDNIMALSKLYGISVDELLCNENPVSMDESELSLERSAADDTPIGTADGVENIEISAKADIELIGTDGDACTVTVEGPEKEKEKVRVFTEGDTLSVIQDDDEEPGFFGRLFGNNGNPNLSVTIRLPRRMRAIEAKLKGGSLKASSLGAEKVELKTGGGRSSIEDCSVRTLEIKTGGGSILLRNVTGDTAELLTGGGGIKAETVDFSDRIEAKTGGGGVMLSGRVPETEAKSGGGDIRLFLDAAERVEVMTGGGGISAELTGTDGVKARLVSGGGMAKLVINGETIQSGHSVNAEIGSGKTVVDAKSGGGSVKVSIK